MQKAVDFIDENELLTDSVEQISRKANISLNDVKALAEKQVLLDEEISTLEIQLEIKKKELKKIAEEQLPEMLLSVGLSSLTLSDGSMVNVSEQVAASIGDDNRVQAHGWLRDNGFGDLIKNAVTVTFGKGEDQDAQNLMDNIQQMAGNDQLHFGTLDQKETVHPSTLKAFVKERLKEGKPLPADTFKLFVRQVAMLKRAKQ